MTNFEYIVFGIMTLCAVDVFSILKPIRILEFDVAPIDPILTNTPVPKNGSGTKIRTSNLTVTGPSDFMIADLDADVYRQKYQFRVTFPPHMHVIENYGVDGKIAKILSKRQGEVINKAINANFVMFFMELRPILQKVLEEFVLDTVGWLTKHFTYEQLFPD